MRDEGRLAALQAARNKPVGDLPPRRNAGLVTDYFSREGGDFRAFFAVRDIIEIL